MDNTTSNAKCHKKSRPTSYVGVPHWNCLRLKIGNTPIRSRQVTSQGRTMIVSTRDIVGHINHTESRQANGAS